MTGPSVKRGARTSRKYSVHRIFGHMMREYFTRQYVPNAWLACAIGLLASDGLAL
jgi:hypothetical protein